MVIRKERIGSCLYIMTIDDFNVLTLKEDEPYWSISTVIKTNIDELNNFINLGDSDIHLILKIKRMSSLEFLNFCTLIRVYPNIESLFIEFIRNLFR